MTHAHNLQPNVVFSQQLIVGSPARNIKTMNCYDEKEAFAARMNEVADRLGIPPKGKNRQLLLGKKFGVSQEAARKWLTGESLPKLSQCIEIAKKSGVTIEWLMTGRGVEVYANTPEAKVLMAMQQMDVATKYQLVKIGNSLTEPNGDDADPETTTPKQSQN